MAEIGGALLRVSNGSANAAKAAYTGIASNGLLRREAGGKRLFIFA